MKKVVRYFLFGVAGLVAILTLVLIALEIYAPPSRVKPGDDLRAAGTPALPLAMGSEESYEPHIGIDPGNPERIAVAAMYGNRFGRAGKGIYFWSSENGGQNWNGTLVPAARFQGVFAADPLIAFDKNGRVYVLSMFANTKIPQRPTSYIFQFLLSSLISRARKKANPMGIAITSTGHGEFDFSKPLIVTSGQEEDKPWFISDLNPESPFHDSMYAMWSCMKGGKLFSMTVPSAFVYSHNGGKTFSKPKIIAESAYGVQLAVRPDGRLDIVYFHQGDQTLYHMISSDGGLTFTDPLIITPSETGVKRDLPSLAAAPDNSLLLCWPESTSEVGPRVKCATYDDQDGWSTPIDLAPDASDDTLIGYPAAAASQTGLWVLAYRSEKQTEVILYRSTDGGRSFLPYEVLGKRTFGRKKFCTGVGHDTTCRFNPVTRKFMPGDYVGLSAVGKRVAAAFVLPRENSAVGFANVYVRVKDVPTSGDF